MKQMYSSQFYRHVLPSMISFAFTGIYTIVDGIFVGLKVSDTGLAAINIAYPILAFILAIGTGIGMAGAIHIAIYKGQKEEDQALSVCGNTITLLILSGLLCTLILWPIRSWLLTVLGAEGIVFNYAQEYLNVILLGSVFHLTACGINPIIRNYNGSITAMNSMIFGFSANIFLDWLFVFHWNFGTAGAAFATVLAQVLSLIPCVIFFMKRKTFFKNIKFQLNAYLVKKIASASISPFALTLSPSISIVILNYACLTYGGTDVVACYAVISYIICIVQLLLQGIGDGVQPLIGQYYGAKNWEALHYLQNKSYLFSLITAILNFLVLYPLRHVMPYWFGASSASAELFAYGIHYFYIGQLFVSFIRVSISYFYAINQNLNASILIYGEILLQTLFLLFLPQIMGIDGIWLSVAAAQFILLITAFFLVFRHSQDPAKKHA